MEPVGQGGKGQLVHLDLRRIISQTCSIERPSNYYYLPPAIFVDSTGPALVKNRHHYVLHCLQHVLDPHLYYHYPLDCQNC